MYGLHAKSIATPNVMVGVLVFYGGVCQFIAGIMEFITGNTVSFSRASMNIRLLTAQFILQTVRCNRLLVIWRLQSILRYDLLARFRHHRRLHEYIYR